MLWLLLNLLFKIRVISTSSQKQETIQKKATKLGLNLDGLGFSVAAAHIDAKKNNNWGKDGEDAELLKYAILNITQENIGKYAIGEVFYQENMVIIFCFDEHEKTKIIQKSFLVLEEIRQTVEKYLKIIITIGLGSSCALLSGVYESYQSAISALDYKLMLGVNKVIFIEDLEPKAMETVIFDENKERMLINSIKFGTEEDILEAVETVFKDIASCKISFKDCQLYLLEIIAAISKISSRKIIDQENMYLMENQKLLFPFSN